MIELIRQNRKSLISIFLTLGITSSLFSVVILTQRTQIYRSQATTPEPEIEISSLNHNIGELNSPKGSYSLTYDKRQWTYTLMPDETFGQRVVFSLNNEYGFARLDIIEYESNKDLEILANEIITTPKTTAISIERLRFKDKLSYLVKYKEQILGQDSYYQQQIIKENNKILIFEKRVPLLGYNEVYLENLLEGLSFGNTESKEVKGVSTLTTVELVELIRPSIVNIVYTYCLDVVNLEPATSGLSKPRYEFCGSSKGSGFIVNDSGIIATNGHVVKAYPEEALVTNLLFATSKSFTTDLIKSTYLSSGQAPTHTEIEDFYEKLKSNPQYIDIFLTEIFDLTGKKVISLSTNNEKYYVNVGKDPVRIDDSNTVTPSSTTYTAKLLDFDFPNKYSYEAIVNKNYSRGSDVAILQIDKPSNSSFVALKLWNTQDLKEGSDVVIAGYPTLVEGQDDPRAAISYKTSTKPTITKGIISSVKEDLTGKTIFQTDASIDHGNSGGPAFNSLGQVIGIATFAEESKTGNFNFLRDISELKELLAKNNIDNNLGNATNAWKDGLNAFWNRRFSQAIKEFEKVESLSPSHPNVKEFIQNSQENIKEGKSLEGFKGFIQNDLTLNIALGIFGSISIISFMLAGFLYTLPLFAKESTFS